MNYIVKSGDSLSKIARDVLGDITLWVEVAKLNKIADPNKIYPGQVLNLDIAKRVTIDITSGTPKIIAETEVMPQKKSQGSSATGWLIGFGVAALAVAAYKKSKTKKQKEK